MSAPLGVSGVLTSSALSLEYGRQKENLELSLDVPSQFAFFSPPFRVFVLYPYVCFIANVQGFKLYLANQEKVIFEAKNGQNCLFLSKCEYQK